MNSYIVDPLYGVIEFNQVMMKIIKTTEVQRLREVRLCNVSSLFLTGSANTNRFEHSLGTCYLANKFIIKNVEKLDYQKQEKILIAALLHDVMNPALGHSLEYIFKKKTSYYDPVEGLKAFIRREDSTGKYYGKTDYLFNTTYYYKNKANLSNVFELFPDEYINDVTLYINGQGEFGKLISGSIDLDNIDNICRMAYHMGIPFDHELPEKLVDIFEYDGSNITISNRMDYIKQWQDLREKLYLVLLFNPDEFSAKAMLLESVEILGGTHLNYDMYWTMIDSEVFSSLVQKGIVKSYYLESYATVLLNELSDENQLYEEVARIIPGKLTKKSIVSIADFYGEWEKTEIKSNNVIYNMNYCSGNNTVLISRRVNFEHDITSTIKRLMVGDLYDCIGIYTSKRIDRHAEWLFDHKMRRMIETHLKNYVADLLGIKMRNDNISIHGITDKNKIRRRVFEEDLSSNQILIGVFLRSNNNISAEHIRMMSEYAFNFIEQCFSDETLANHELYSEKEAVK